MDRPLVRSSDPKVAGVCGGLADWLDVDPTAVRIVWLLSTFFTAVFPGFVIYFLLWIMMPAADAGAVSSGTLARSREHSILAGVCGGVADWLGWDPTMVRIFYVVASICSACFPGTVVYILLWLLLPEAGEARRSVL
jgi:phage shock protein C